MPEGVQLWNFRPYETIAVQRISGALGAEISGIDLTKPLTDALYAEIYQAFLENQVIFFRDQHMTPEQFLAFARRWGGIHLHPYMKGLDEIPEILELIKTETDTYAFGSSWHSDQMFAPKPAKCTMLLGREIPPAGGDTMFANMYLAYESLSPGMRATLDRLKALNSGDKKRGGGTKNRAERYSGAQGMKLKDPGNIQTDSVHPLVRTHADTGRKGLYLGSHTQHLDGFTPEESEPILSFLRAHCRRPEFTCRFRWAPGSLAIWDNRCAQHYAINDYAGYRRRMHRITIKGEDAPF
ncbi:MAG: taurine dioxygenase [Alphaproteobacteria bacterium]|nr:taurine dioxygenase [Alphaproteobacteria bacterium]